MKYDKWNFIPAKSGGPVCSNNECLLTSLHAHYGGLAIPILTNELTNVEYENTRKVPSSLSQWIVNQHLNTKLIKMIQND